MDSFLMLLSGRRGYQTWSTDNLYGSVPLRVSRLWLLAITSSPQILVGINGYGVSRFHHI